MKRLVSLSILIVLLSACVTSPTGTPTLRPTMSATKTLRPTPTRTPRPVSLNACVTNTTIRVRRGPGTQYEVIGGLVSGTCMTILGRNEDLMWVYMASEDNKKGWVNASLLTIDGDLRRVAVQGDLEVSSLSPATKVVPTQKLPTTATRKPIVLFTSTPRPLVIQPTANDNSCSPAYPGVCIPPRPPDLDCGMALIGMGMG
jgi:uncharacterized protein YgiM (DUF1202 family)